MKDKKLCFVIPSFGIGGIEINFQKLANHFNWSGYDVHIMYHAEEDNGSFQSNFHEEIELDKLPKRKFLGNVFGYLKYFNKKKTCICSRGHVRSCNAANCCKIYLKS